MNITIAVVVILYLVVTFLIGLWTGRGGSESETAYYTGDKAFGPLVTAISAGATNSSGWIYIGACGWAYQVGILSMWMVPGFVIGALIEYILLAPRLRHQSAKLGALSVSDYLEKRLHKEWNEKASIVRVIAAISLILFFIPYMSTQLTAAGKTIQTLIDIDYNIGLVAASIFVIGFCYSGGYTSVVYTDTIQGLIMLGVFIIAPLIIIFGMLGGWNSFWHQLCQGKGKMS